MIFLSYGTVTETKSVPAYCKNENLNSSSLSGSTLLIIKCKASLLQRFKVSLSMPCRFYRYFARRPCKKVACRSRGIFCSLYRVLESNFTVFYYLSSLRAIGVSLELPYFFSSRFIQLVGSGLLVPFRMAKQSGYSAYCLLNPISLIPLIRLSLSSSKLL